LKKKKRLPNSLQPRMLLLLPLMLKPLNKLPSTLQPLPLPPKQGKLKKPLLLPMLKRRQLVLAGTDTTSAQSNYLGKLKSSNSPCKQENVLLEESEPMR
jgi:hypothetical protein